jgi:hypothetical protein
VRIAFLPDGASANAAYRSIGPMKALGERGHEVRQLQLEQRRAWPEILRWCELLHVHRVCDEGAVELVRGAKAAGAAVVWDDDDDVTRVPRRVADGYSAFGAKGARRLAARAKLFRAVDLVTTPSRVLADAFREGGAPEARVIENYVLDDLLTGGATGEGLRIGWVAASEHRLDLEQIPVMGALERLLAAHPHVRVTTIGVRLGLPEGRYRHVPPVILPEMLRELAAFDIGIAPLSPDVAINQARSNIKLKEYAAVGVPWLASPIGPYAGLGEKQGGRLVADDGWHDALARLLDKPRERAKLAKRAGKWVAGETLTKHAAEWEARFEEAISRARAAAAA